MNFKNPESLKIFDGVNAVPYVEDNELPDRFDAREKWEGKLYGVKK
jgi:hypothetical protein